MIRHKRILVFCVSIALFVAGRHAKAVNGQQKILDYPARSTGNRASTKVASEGGKCRPANVPSGFGVPPGTNMNELAPQPKTRAEFDDWLANYGGLRLAEETDRDALDQYYYEADFNGDGCRDVVLMVRGVEDKTGDVSLESTSVEVTVQNLRTNAFFAGGDESKLPFAPKFAAQIKPQEPIALLVVLGGESGWSWKHAGRKRCFLLYDSIYQSRKSAKLDEAVTIFGVVEKSKPQNDDDDLLPLLPQEAVGDCIQTELNTSAANSNYVMATKRSLIGFNGTKFVLKKLSDAKLFKE